MGLPIIRPFGAVRLGVFEIIAVFLCLALGGCTSSGKSVKSPNALPGAGFPELIQFFQSLPQHRLEISVDTPELNYSKDPAEKDLLYQLAPKDLNFSRVTITLALLQEKSKALVDMAFSNDSGTSFTIHSLDLLDLVPLIGQKGVLKYAEFLLKEFERFGILFYKKENAFSWTTSAKTRSVSLDAIGRTYQAGVFNNCLDAGKWEIVINSRYYEQFDSTHANTNQNQRYRVLVHSWFSLDSTLYRLLVKIKNPVLDFDPYIKYSELTKMAEAVKVPFSTLSKFKRTVDTKVLELGYRSQRELFELDEEEMYKDWFGLVLNREKFHTYADILETPVRMAQFTDKGFYRPEVPLIIDYGWMKKLDQVEMKMIETSGPERFVEIRIWGEHCPYAIVLGNFDLGRLNPNKTVAIQFGVNPFPKMRLQRKTAFGTGYNLGPDGKAVQPYLFLIDRVSEKWINNQKLGLEQVFIGWQSINKEALVIHLVSYERMLPIWITYLGISDAERGKGRIANAVFKPEDTTLYSSSTLTLVRKEREALRANYLGKLDSADTLILNFETLGHKDNKLVAHGFYYDEQGFMLLSGGFLTASPFRSIGETGYPYKGSTGLINGQDVGVNYLMKRDEVVDKILNLDDNLFGLISIDVGRFNSLTKNRLTFVGVLRDSSTVSQSFELNPDFSPKTLIFGPQFQEIATLRWVSHSTIFDNIKIIKTAKATKN
jgi:hypothetical protein